MNIRDEEQLQQYFERQMSGAQEQNFLINVAARDDMRLAFRSQLELLKAVREDKDSSGSPTFVRSKTLTALGLGGALVPSSLKENETQQASILPTSFLQNVGSAFKRPMVSITLGLLLGMLGTSFFMSSNNSQELNTPSPAVIAVPVAPATGITIQPTVTSDPSKDLQKPTENASANVVKPTSHIAQHISHKQNLPIINNSKPGSVDLKTTITNPDKEAGKK